MKLKSDLTFSLLNQFFRLVDTEGSPLLCNLGEKPAARKKSKTGLNNNELLTVFAAEV